MAASAATSEIWRGCERTLGLDLGLGLGEGGERRASRASRCFATATCREHGKKKGTTGDISTGEGRRVGAGREWMWTTTEDGGRGRGKDADPEMGQRGWGRAANTPRGGRRGRSEESAVDAVCCAVWAGVGSEAWKWVWPGLRCGWVDGWAVEGEVSVSGRVGTVGTVGKAGQGRVGEVDRRPQTVLQVDREAARRGVWDNAWEKRDRGLLHCRLNGQWRLPLAGPSWRSCPIRQLSSGTSQRTRILPGWRRVPSRPRPRPTEARYGTAVRSYLPRSLFLLLARTAVPPCTAPHRTAYRTLLSATNPQKSFHSNSRSSCPPPHTPRQRAT